MLKQGGIVLGVVLLASVAAAEDAAVPTTMDVLRAQIEMERGKEQELQMLQLEVERLKLEVEKKKAILELGKMGEPSVTGMALDGPDAPPSILLRYVLMVGGRKEALVDVNGLQSRVQEGQEAGGGVVKRIFPDGIVWQGRDGKESSFRLAM